MAPTFLEMIGTEETHLNTEEVDVDIPEPTKDENGKDVYLCDSCGSLFAYSYSLVAHKRHKCHAGKGEFKCEMCNKRFNFPSQLQRHMPTHTGEKPFQCNHCPKAFNESSNLKQHMLIHTDQKPFCCDFVDCDKRFRSASNLKVHVRTHTKERPYICEFAGCGKRFVSAGDLKRHFRIHTKERPYVCQYCGKSFIQGPYLNIHIRSHTKEKPYNCTHCGKAFSRTSTLKIHLRLHSGEKATEKSVKPRTSKTGGSSNKSRDPLLFPSGASDQVVNSTNGAKSDSYDHGTEYRGSAMAAGHLLPLHPTDNYSYMQSLMYDYGDREVPCGTLPNGQTVPLTGRNASIVRPRPKRAEGTLPVSPDQTIHDHHQVQIDKMGSMLPPIGSSSDFYSHVPPRPLATFPPMIDHMPPSTSSTEKIPPLVPVPLPAAPYPFSLGPGLHSMSGDSYPPPPRREFPEQYAPLRDPPAQSDERGGFKPYSATLGTSDHDSKLNVGSDTTGLSRNGDNVLQRRDD